MKKLMSMVVTLALGIFGALIAAPAANSAPVTVADWTYYRNGHSDGTTLDFFTGEDAVAKFSAIIGPEWSGWGRPEKKKYKFTTSDFSVTDGSPDFFQSLSLFYQWEGTNSTDDDCYESDLFTTKFVLPQRTCVDTVTYSAVVLMPESTEDGTMWSDADEAEYRGNGRLITTDDGLSFDAYALIEASDQSSITVNTDYVSDITVQATMCVDESLIDNGDEAARVFAVKFEGLAISESQSTVVPWVDWWTPESESVSLEGEEPLQDLTDTAAGWVTTPDVGNVTVTVTADLRKGGSSILEPCRQDYAGPLDTGTQSGTPSASDVTRTLPSAFSWSGGEPPLMVSDGFGGVFALESESDDSGDESNLLTHLGASGDNDSFAGDGVANIDFPGSAGVAHVGRWGAGGSHWFAASYWESGFSLSSRSPRVAQSGSMMMTTGSMTTSSTNTVAIDESALAVFCDRPNAVIDYVEPISAPMEKPLLRVDCHYKASKKSRYVPVSALVMVDTSADNTLVGVGGFPSSSMGGAELVFMDVSVNPAATDRETAVLVYTQSSKFKRLGSEFVISSIEPDGTRNIVSLPANPFGARAVESLQLVPGATEGTWLGVVAQPYWARRNYFPNEHIVKLTNGDTFTLSAEVDTGYPGMADVWSGELVPLGSDSEFGQISFARSMFDGDAIGDVELITWDVATGDTSTGEPVPTVDPTEGYEPMLWASPGVGDPTFFWISSETEYQVVTWNLP